MADASKKSQRKEWAFFGCSNRMYDAKGKRTSFNFFQFPKDIKLRKIWQNHAASKSGKDGFRITEVTVVCHLHLSGTYCLLQGEGGLINLRKGAVPFKWNDKPREIETKRKAV